MAVSFSRSGRLHYLDPGEHRPVVGSKVLVPTATGNAVAECVWAPAWVDDGVGGLPVCDGLATDEDLAKDQAKQARRAEARAVAVRLIRQHGLPMKVIAVDNITASGLTIYFTAPGRVDFRALVRDLASRLRARVELRQIGPRDEAKLQGGIGPCGRDLCCTTCLREFEPVTIKMAKDQDIAVNPMRIAGSCGRLMCCLNYEHPLYLAFRAGAPGLGAAVDSPEGEGTVVGFNVPTDSVVVKVTETGARIMCQVESVCPARREHEARYGRKRSVPENR